MGEQITKLILIRYNKRVGYDRQAAWYTGKPVNLDPDWLAERLRLFQTYCWPSLARQTQGDFLALLLMDPATDAKYLSRLVTDDRIRPVMMDGANQESIGSAVAGFVRTHFGTTQRIVQTTRLDSDDALAPTFLEQVAVHAENVEGGPVGKYFYFPMGQQYIEDRHQYRRYIYPHNAFGTLIGRFDGCNLRNVMAKKHTELCRASYACRIESPDAKWCMVIHGQNVLNTARGTEIAVPDFRVGHNAEL